MKSNLIFTLVLLLIASIANAGPINVHCFQVLDNGQKDDKSYLVLHHLTHQIEVASHKFAVDQIESHSYLNTSASSVAQYEETIVEFTQANGAVSRLTSEGEIRYFGNEFLGIDKLMVKYQSDITLDDSIDLACDEGLQGWGNYSRSPQTN